MEEFATDKNQMEKVAEFKRVLNTSGSKTDLFFFGMLMGLKQKIAVMENLNIEGQVIKNTEVYKTHLPVFLSIAEKTTNLYSLLGIFGVDLEKVFALDKDKATKEEILSTLGFNKEQIQEIGDEKVEKKVVLNMLTDKYTVDANRKMNETVYFSNEHLNQILNGLKEYQEISEKVKTDDDKKRREYLSGKLYSDAYEIYIKILKEIYSKLEGVKIDEIKNGKMYDYLNKNYKILFDTANNKLRNDFCHLLYKERDKYTIEQIDQDRTTILLKAYTGLIAKHIFMVGTFEKSSIFDEQKAMEQLLEEVVGVFSKKAPKKKHTKKSSEKLTAKQ